MFTFFWRDKSPFSQWFTRNFIVHGIKFTCMEQYMMWSKAKLFKDEKTAEKIMLAKHPGEMKALGRDVTPFDPVIWNAHKEQIVEFGNYCKFMQNPDLKKILLDTAGTILVEASPYDTIWGIGLDEKAAKTIDPAKWPGQNLLGQALTRVREHILKEQQNEKTL